MFLAPQMQSLVILVVLGEEGGHVANQTWMASGNEVRGQAQPAGVTMFPLAVGVSGWFQC